MTIRRLVALGVFFAATLAAKEWLVRTYELPAAGMTMAVQDTTGFLWIGSGQGLYRFDGARFVRWAPDIFGQVNYLAAGPANEVFALSDRDSPLYRVTPSGAVVEMEHVTGVVTDSEGRVWIARDDGLHVLEPGASAWRKESDKTWDGRNVILYPAQKGSIFVTTNTGMWRARPGLLPAKIWTSRHMVNPLETSDGYLYVSEEGAGTSTLYRSRGESKEKLLTWRGRYCATLERAGSVWIFADGVSAVVRPGLRLVVLRPQERVFLGSGVLVDREGSMWTGRPSGLSVVPEPDTEIWTLADGLPDLGARNLLERPDGIWVSSWTGLFRMTPDRESWRVDVQPVVHYGPLCVDSHGTIWSRRPWRLGRFERLQFENWACAPSADGTVWLGAERLFHTTASFGRPQPVRTPSGLDELSGILEDREGTLWITAGERICSRPASAALAEKGPDWECRTLPGAKEVFTPVQLESRSIWVGTRAAGLWRFDGGRWGPVPGAGEFLNGPVFSRNGGVWILGITERRRVVEDRASPDGWRVVDRVNAWQGVPKVETVSVLEPQDGSLWFSTNIGLVRMSPHASGPKPAPSMAVIRIEIDGKRREPGGLVQIPPGENHLEVEFAALSYRDRSLLRYQYRLRPDAAWSEANEREPLFRFVGLRTGDYRLEVRASLDGVNWSAAPAVVRLQALGPWYGRWQAFVWFAALISAVLYAAHRARMAVVLRLERQRSRIAMDLHDGIGSGLGSIGILSGLAASDHVNEDQRRDFVSRIAETSQELGLALSDIVWSLRPDSDTVEALAIQLARRGNSLFPNSRPRFEADFPASWPLMRLPVFERRNLLLIGQEALHNAARHSRAGVVTLIFRQQGEWWTMQIDDDGCGLQNARPQGMGLSNMKHRSEAIGALIEFDRAPGGGVSVKLRFRARVQRAWGAS